MSLDSRTDLPKTSYATALDWFIIMCFAYVIASMLEYAGVHYFTKIGSGDGASGPEEFEEFSNHVEVNYSCVSATDPEPDSVFLPVSILNKHCSYYT